MSLAFFFASVGLCAQASGLAKPANLSFVPNDKAAREKLFIPNASSWGKDDSLSWRANGSPTLFDTVFAAEQAFIAAKDPAGLLKKNFNY